MSLISFPIATGNSKHPSQDVNNQVRYNLFTSPAGAVGRGDSQSDNFVLLPTGGLNLLVASGGTTVRALINLDDTKQYAIIDLTVYLLTINDVTLTGTLTSIGTLTGSATTQISWARNKTQVMLVNGEANWGYIISTATNTLIQITDVDFLGGETVMFMDTYFIYNQPGTQKMFASAINDGTDFNALDTAEAESKADNLVGLLEDKRELLAFGLSNIELWYDAANPTGFPFSVRPGEYYDIGCSAKMSILSIDNTVFFLDHRRYITSLSSDSGLQVLSTPELRAEFATYSVVSDARAYELQEAGQLMYVLVFPTAQKVWVYDLVTKHFHQRAYWNGTGYERHRVNVCVKYKQYYIAGDYANGNIYLYGADYLTDNGDTIRRSMTTAYLHNQDQRITLNSIYIHGEFGKGLTTGQGSDPQVMMRYSHDGGYTWSNELWESMGALGNYNTRVKWYRLGSERDWQFEFVITDPVKFSISEFGIDLELDNV